IAQEEGIKYWIDDNKNELRATSILYMIISNVDHLEVYTDILQNRNVNLNISHEIGELRDALTLDLEDATKMTNAQLKDRVWWILSVCSDIQICLDKSIHNTYEVL